MHRCKTSNDLEISQITNAVMELWVTETYRNTAKEVTCMKKQWKAFWRTVLVVYSKICDCKWFPVLQHHQYCTFWMPPLSNTPDLAHQLVNRVLMNWTGCVKGHVPNVLGTCSISRIGKQCCRPTCRNDANAKSTWHKGLLHRVVVHTCFLLCTGDKAMHNLAEHAISSNAHHTADRDSTNHFNAKSGQQRHCTTHCKSWWLNNGLTLTNCRPSAWCITTLSGSNSSKMEALLLVRIIDVVPVPIKGVIECTDTIFLHRR